MDRTTDSPSLHTAHAAQAPHGQPLRSTPATGGLQGRTLVIARAAWLAIAALTCSLYVASMWPQFRQLLAPCRIARSAPITRLPPDGPVCPYDQVPLAVARALAALHLSVEFIDWYAIGLDALFAVGFVAIAALLFWRRSHDLLALYISFTLLIFGTISFHTGPIARLVATRPGWWLPVALLQFLGAAAFGILGYVFPDGRFVPRWTMLAAAGFALWFLPAYLFPGSALDFSAMPKVASFGGWAAFLGTVGVAQVYRYRSVSTLAQREQTKWVVFGILAASVGYFAGKLVVTLTPMPTSPAAVLAYPIGGTLIYVGFLLIPLSIGIAILRHRLFDIDLILRRTMVYSVLIATLALLYEGGALVLEKVLLTSTGQSGLVTEVALAFGVGVLAEPLHHRIERAIARVFYWRKYEAERQIETFSKQLRREWEVAPRSEEWEDALRQRMERAWTSVRRRPTPTSTYIQESLFP